MEGTECVEQSIRGSVTAGESDESALKHTTLETVQVQLDSLYWSKGGFGIQRDNQWRQTLG